MTAFDPERITYFAKTDARGKELPFGIKAKDRTRHVYVIGKSGMGKSTLLENMAAQDIKNGEGFAFIDPHGQSAEALLEYIPQERLKDVLYFNPSDMAHPVAFNIMENIDPDKRFLVVSGLMSVFKKIWVDAWSARMEYILQNTLMALLEYPGATLLGVNRMLSEKAYREAVVANVQDPSVKSFWVDEFAKYNERYMQEAGDSIKNKIGQFTGNPIIRNIIGQPKSSFNIREIMDGQKIIIMNLSKGLIGETNANLLGSMLTTRIYLAAMSRADLSPREMATTPNFYFYVDEFQSFANATFANILSEARKYKLNLTIAHQYVDQMEEDVRNAVFGNVGTTITFRVGPMDAEVLEKLFSPRFTAIDLVNLGFAQIYLSLMIDGVGSVPFSATTLPPIKMPDVSYRAVTVAQSRLQFAVPRAEIEQKIHDFHAEDFGKKKPSGDASSFDKKDERRGGHAPSARPSGHAEERRREPVREGRAPVAPEEHAQHKDDLRALLKNIAEPAPSREMPREQALPRAVEAPRVPHVVRPIEIVHEQAAPIREETPLKHTASPHDEKPRERAAPRREESPTIFARKEVPASPLRQAVRPARTGEHAAHEERSARRPHDERRPSRESEQKNAYPPRRVRPSITEVEQGRAHDLRSALAAIVADVPKRVDVPAEVRPREMPRVPEEVKIETPVHIQVPVAPKITAPVSVSVPQEVSPVKRAEPSGDINPHDFRAKLRSKASEIEARFEDDNPLTHTITPKALEHMMRVTTSDKAPPSPKYNLSNK